MKNQDFIKNQTEKVLSEMKLFASGQIDHTVIVGYPEKLSLSDSADLNQFKFSLLEMIKEKSEEELMTILQDAKKELCDDCKEGIKVFDIKCGKDLRQFMLCEYIMRSLIDETRLEVGPDG